MQPGRRRLKSLPGHLPTSRVSGPSCLWGAKTALITSGPVPDQEPAPASAAPQAHQQVPRLLHRPRATWARGDADDTPTAGAPLAAKTTCTRALGYPVRRDLLLGVAL